MVHSAGLYSFFNEYCQDCIASHNCQTRILEVKGSTGVVIFNLFTVATVIIEVPGITTDGIGYSNVNVTSGSMPITVRPSVPILPMGVTLPDGKGGTTVRTVPLPPGIYGPGPPPIKNILLPPGITIKGKLPPWPRLTIGPDHQLTTEKEPKCETKTAEACTWTTYITGGETKSSTSACETITGCSISVTESSTEVIGKQTIAPVGTWIGEHWPTTTLGAAYTNSVYAALMARMARDEAEGEGTTLDVTPGLTAGPTCPGTSSACGGTVCSGYWCTASPTGPPPAYQDPNDPNSGGYMAPTKTVGTSEPPPGTSNPPSDTPTTPLKRGPINCYKKSDFPGHADLHSGSQDAGAKTFSGQLASDKMLIGPDDPPVKYRYTDKRGVNHDYSCTWVSGCKTSVDKQNFQFPDGNNTSQLTAYVLVREDYTKSLRAAEAIRQTQKL
ncbi:hypothetical protein BM221_010289 [Beauveria bassiana]|uniref:Uncharacterized protein n=1 Tax=Beauveria bassiana TaxID=176275 RepID=A0A2N6N980_BEABA|nr:hypothetical protein BM221_010289 [Beauveria bassiana]